jgi:hypothetical protein
MGQQQLLLIVLSIIIVGIAVVVGINMFNSSADSSQVDAVTSDCTTMAAAAQQYYIKPASMGGGGNSFAGLTAAKLMPAQGAWPAGSNDNGTYTVTPNGATDCVLVGTPRRATAATKIGIVTTTVTPANITTVVAPGT